jgi:hypothetical protein
MNKPQTPPILMDYEIFKQSCNYMYQALVAQAYSYLSQKPEDWLQKYIPIVEYSEAVSNHIFATAAAITLTENITVFEVNGQWLRIIVKPNH